MRQMHLRHDIYFSLTRKQQQRVHSLGYCGNTLDMMRMSEFKSVTKNKRLIDMMIELKRMSIKLVA